MIGNQPWTDEENRRLRELAASAKTVEEIARQLNRSPAAIKTRAIVLKIRVATSGYIRGLKAKGK